MAESQESSSDSVAQLVLDYLASKGFSSAETALREQLKAQPDPPPATESNFSELESMLIRGHAAAAQSEVEVKSKSVLQPLAPPGTEAAEEDAPLAHKISQMSLAGAGAHPAAQEPARAPIVWHDPTGQPDEDEWTDDEGLGYVQIEVSEDTILRGFAAAAARADAADTSRAADASRDARDPIFEMYENEAAAAAAMEEAAARAAAKAQHEALADGGVMADDEGDDDDDEGDEDDDADDTPGSAAGVASWALRTASCPGWPVVLRP